MPAPAPKNPTTPPLVSKANGEVYFQPVIQAGDTEESYNARLKDIKNGAHVELEGRRPVNSPGSFSLLTQRGANGMYSGHTRFDDETAVLEEEKGKLLQEVEKNEKLSKDPSLYKGKDDFLRFAAKNRADLVKIDKAENVFRAAGSDHYMSAKNDASFATTGKSLQSNELQNALGLVTSLKGKKVGEEVRQKKSQEMQTLRDSVRTLKDEISTLEDKAKRLLQGKLPPEVLEDLDKASSLLQTLYTEYDASQLGLSDEEDLIKMKVTLDSIADGTALHGSPSNPETKPKDVGDILTEMLKDEVDITPVSLAKYFKENNQLITSEEADAIFVYISEEMNK